MEIIPIVQFGHMQVYMRQRGKETNVLKYIVIDRRTGWTVEEFRRKDSAIKWARECRNGMEPTTETEIEKIS